MEANLISLIFMALIFTISTNQTVSETDLAVSIIKNGIYNDDRSTS